MEGSVRRGRWRPILLGVAVLVAYSARRREDRAAATILSAAFVNIVARQISLEQLELQQSVPKADRHKWLSEKLVKSAPRLSSMVEGALARLMLSDLRLAVHLEMFRTLHGEMMTHLERLADDYRSLHEKGAPARPTQVIEADAKVATSAFESAARLTRQYAERCLALYVLSSVPTWNRMRTALFPDAFEKQCIGWRRDGNAERNMKGRPFSVVVWSCLKTLNPQRRKRPMGHKYVGLDVHQSSTVAAVHDEQGKSVMESILATEAEAIRDFLKGLRGTIHVTFEEGTQAAWLYEIVKPVVAEVIVCNPRRNKLLAVGNKADRVDAQKLAELLRCGQLKPVYHGTPGVRLLKELVHSYDSLVSDTTRVMNRVKAIYRGRAIGCAGRDVYYQRNREQWLEKLTEPGVRQRAVFLYQQLDTLRGLRREAKKAMLKESRRHPAYRDLETDSGVGADSDCPDPGEGGQSAPVSDQAAVLGLLWVGRGDAIECGLSVSRREGGEAQTSADDARIESELQSSAQVRL